MLGLVGESIFRPFSGLDRRRKASSRRGVVRWTRPTARCKGGRMGKARGDVIVSSGSKERRLGSRTALVVCSGRRPGSVGSRVAAEKWAKIVAVSCRL